jgi:hypothetical protein
VKHCFGGYCGFGRSVLLGGMGFRGSHPSLEKSEGWGTQFVEPCQVQIRGNSPGD